MAYQTSITVMSLIVSWLCVCEGDSFNYCELSCNKTKHTICEFPPGGGDGCKNNEAVFLSVKEKKWILEMHNSFRQSVARGEVNKQPRASNMMKLAWDGEIGLFAKRWADQCGRPQHDSCRTAMDGVDVGQNVYMGSYTYSGSVNVPSEMRRAERIQSILQTWKGEVKNPNQVLTVYPNTSWQVANYTQMIWAETLFMGCGYTEFDVGDNTIDFRFVCNYKRKGNIPYQHVYRVGQPCSSCPPRSNCSDTWSALCWDGSENYFLDKEVDGQPGAARLQRVLLIVVLLGLLS